MLMFNKIINIIKKYLVRSLLVVFIVVFVIYVISDFLIISLFN